MNKKVMLYLWDDEYDWLKAKSDSERTSMNRVVQEWIREQLTSKVLVNKHQPTSKLLVKGIIKSPKDAEKIVKQKFSNLCEHGRMKGLCEKGCK